MHISHGTLRGLTLHLCRRRRRSRAAAAVLDVVLTNARRTPRYGIGLRVLDAHAAHAGLDRRAGAAAARRRMSASCRRARGLHDVPTLTAETRFPLGLFRAWTVWRPAAQLLVYPRAGAPIRRRCRAARPVRRRPRRSRARSDGGEFEGVRAYRRGDPLKLVVWKKAAQALETGAELVSRDTSDVGAPGALARLAACAACRRRGAPVAPGGLDAGGRPRRRRLRPAPARRSSRAGRRRRATPRCLRRSRCG